MTIVGIALVAVFAFAIPALASAAPAATHSPASGSSYEWAFGGSVSSTYSCTSPNCPGDNITNNTHNVTTAAHWDISVTWAVIYTQTNVSASQTEYQVQAGLGASVSLGLTLCQLEPSCTTTESISASVSGHETAGGAVNVTDTAVVNDTAGPNSSSALAALGIMNAATHAAYNLSGSLSLAITSSTQESASFDFGGSESSMIDFATPLGIVPVHPAPGDLWHASEPFTASGHWVSGLSESLTVNGSTQSASVWTPGTVASSGTLNVNGSDNGTTTVYDNYTSPPTSFSADEIALVFSGANFSASDGWLLASTGYLTSIANLGLVSPAVTAARVSPSALAIGGSESVYYTAGSGFIGENFAGNLSSATSTPGAPSLTVTAGPEPVSVAQSQYAAITAAPGKAGLPLELLIGAAVAVVVVVAALALVMRSRSARRKPPTPLNPVPPMAPPPGSSPPSPPGSS